MTICHADQPYYQGKQDLRCLKEPPMALIHSVWNRGRDPLGPINQDRLYGSQSASSSNRVSSLKIIGGTHFLSSGFNESFMQEVVAPPLDRVVKLIQRKFQGPVSSPGGI